MQLSVPRVAGEGDGDVAVRLYSRVSHEHGVLPLGDGAGAGGGERGPAQYAQGAAAIIDPGRQARGVNTPGLKGGILAGADGLHPGVTLALEAAPNVALAVTAHAGADIAVAGDTSEALALEKTPKAALALALDAGAALAGTLHAGAAAAPTRYAWARTGSWRSAARSVADTGHTHAVSVR